ncbi:MAG: hypothetical protein WAK48_03905 [Candidatus Acidiferrum sp.]
MAAVMHLSFESSKKSDSLLDCLWLYHIFSLQTVSNFIGAIEIVVAVLIGVRSFSRFPRNSLSSAALVLSLPSCSP